MKLPSFPRKALEAELELHANGEIGKVSPNGKSPPFYTGAVTNRFWQDQAQSTETFKFAHDFRPDTEFLTDRKVCLLAGLRIGPFSRQLEFLVLPEH